MMPKIRVELIENFLIVWNPQEGSQLYKTAYYGRPVGIPKPKIPEFDVPLVLDLMEGLYLAETEQIEVYEHPSEPVSLEKLRAKTRELYDEFEEKYAVYQDMRNSGLIVLPGIKFGCDFAVYKYGPGVEHAPYMVTVKKPDSDISATEIVKNGRLATTVRKRFIIAVPDLVTKEIKYLMFKWFKA
jgi:tRNA-intron endonuclease, archaea type